MNRNLEIYLQPLGPPMGVLPVQESLLHLNRYAKKHPKLVGEYRSIIMRIEHLAKQFNDAVKIRPSETNRSESLHLKEMLSELVLSDQGAMQCRQCNALIKSEDIIFERFQRGKNGAKASTGKRFYCSKSHLIFELLDFNL